MLSDFDQLNVAFSVSSSSVAFLDREIPAVPGIVVEVRKEVNAAELWI